MSIEGFGRNSLELLAEISRYYGSDSDYVIAGGGNTSFKDCDTLYIKGSGTALSEAAPDAFVKISRKALAKIWETNYPCENDQREAAVLTDLMGARLAGEEHKRPSVETMLHDLLQFNFVVHLHPALVNGITCAMQGKAAMEEIFPEAVWIPSINPGYILSLEVREALKKHRAENGKNAEMIFLQNHGIFVGADNTNAIKNIYKGIMEKISPRIKRRPCFEICENPEINKEFASALAELAGGKAVFLCNKEILRLVENKNSFFPVSHPFTPDHIVYAGSDPLFTRAETASELKGDWENHLGKTGRPPKIAAIQGKGIFGLGASSKTASLALALFTDAVKVAVFSESFGGPLFMEQDKIDFINNWEVEAFRTKVSEK